MRKTYFESLVLLVNCVGNVRLCCTAKFKIAFMSLKLKFKLYSVLIFQGLFLQLVFRHITEVLFN